MKATIYPSQCHGKVVIPASKSMSHRAIICAALAPGHSTISNLAFSDDIKITIEGMRQMGASIQVYDDYIEVDGINNFSNLTNTEVFCKESGSTLRFFIPIFSLFNQTITFTGENRLLKRPQKIYEDIFTSQGLTYYQDDHKIEITGTLKASHYQLAGDVSSQFISGLLFTLPFLEGDSTITIQEPYESRSYVDLTIEMLERFGVQVRYQDQNTLFVRGNQTYKACNYTVEGDYSQTGFFAVLAAINNDLDILGITHDSKQGDRKIIDIIRDFGAQVTPIENGYHITTQPLHPSTIDLQDCPDLGPILNVLMMYTSGTSKIYNAKRLRYKESDRIEAMESELLKLGVNIKTTEDEIIIQGNHEYEGNVDVFSHRDHRIVMSLAIAATKLNKPITIDEAQYISKSYPHFFEDLAMVGVKVELYDN